MGCRSPAGYPSPGSAKLVRCTERQYWSTGHVRTAPADRVGVPRRRRRQSHVAAVAMCGLCIGSEAATVLDRPPAVIAPDYKSSFSTTNENMFLCSLYPTKSGSQSEKSLDGIKESLQTEFEAVEYSPCLLAKMC